MKKCARAALVVRPTLGGLRIAWFSRTDNAEASRKYVFLLYTEYLIPYKADRYISTKAFTVVSSLTEPKKVAKFPSVKKERQVNAS